MRRSVVLLALSFAVLAVVVVVEARVARACGCLSPPLPPPLGEADYAVNQRAEQIIFEVEPGWVTAHVLIKYAGAPDQFAWIVPVPEVPELAISPVTAFGLLDQLTAPDVGVDVENICPISEWSCRYHERKSCGFSASAGDDSPGGLADGGVSDGGGAGQPPVVVIDEQTVGDYQTVTFRASEAAAAVQWLRDNGFIVNQTTSIYMESYIQANMVFVAAKLVPGAGAASIKPLKMKYRAAFPMVPLVLTAVAAEPHLTVTSFIYGAKPFRPLGLPVVAIDRARIAQDPAGRSNYPMVLARTVDEAGGNGFAIEFRGPSTPPQFSGGGCCGGGEADFCGLGGNTQCECPRDAFDRSDCSQLGDLVDGVALLDDLGARYPALTRVTTRISAEEMTFDPTFEPDYEAQLTGKLAARGSQPSLAACASDVIDGAAYADLQALQGCAAVYCGTGGQCAATASGAGCACGPGLVAQRFIDLDGKPSVTCVPKVPPVDLRAGGLQLPDACANVSCGLGECVDRNGVAVCECDAGAAAVPTTGERPTCVAIAQASHTPGAQDYSEVLREYSVCAPAPPACGEDGWLTQVPSPRPGINCGNANPPWQATIAPPKPSCGLFGCGCSGGGDAHPIAIAASGLLFAVVLRKRRRRAAARPS